MAYTRARAWTCAGLLALMPLSHASAASLGEGAANVLTNPANGQPLQVSYISGDSSIELFRQSTDGSGIGLLDRIGVEWASPAGAELLPPLYNWTDPSQVMSTSGVTLDYNDDTGRLNTVTWRPGVLADISAWGENEQGVAWLGRMSIANLSIDLNNQRLMADVTGTPSTGNNLAASDLALFSFDTVTGVEALPTAEQWLDKDAGAITSKGLGVIDSAPNTREVRGLSVYEGLRLTDEGLAFMQASLGLAPTEMTRLLNANNSANGLGRMGLRYTLSANIGVVPEVGTLALMALGLVGIGLARQRVMRTC